MAYTRNMHEHSTLASFKSPRNPERDLSFWTLSPCLAAASGRNSVRSDLFIATRINIILFSAARRRPEQANKPRIQDWQPKRAGLKNSSGRRAPPPVQPLVFLRVLSRPLRLCVYLFV